MKRIGLIGGISRHSTAEYIDIICSDYEKKFGQWETPDLIVQYINLAELARFQKKNDWLHVAGLVAEAVYRLKKAGADFAAIASNTPHNAYDMICDLTQNFKILSIMDATVEAVKKDGLKKVGLLGTRQTMEYGYFQKAFSKYGITAFTPNRQDRELIDMVIWEELTLGEIYPASKQAFVDIIDGLKVRNGIEGVVLGCTEIPMLVKPEDAPIKTYDTTRIHANAILEYALT